MPLPPLYHRQATAYRTSARPNETITTVGRRGQTEQVARGEPCNNGRYLLRRRVVRLIEDNMRDVQECWRDTSRQALHEGDRQPLAHATLTITDEANLMA